MTGSVNTTIPNNRQFDELSTISDQHNALTLTLLLTLGKDYKLSLLVSA